MTDIKMIAISEILKKVKTTADCYSVESGTREWFRMISFKMQDKQTPAIIRAIETNGFTDPICIEMHTEDRWELGNGHHRLCIAILLGLDEVPVDTAGWFTANSSENQEKIRDDLQPEDQELAHWISATAVSGEDMGF